MKTTTTPDARSSQRAIVSAGQAEVSQHRPRMQRHVEVAQGDLDGLPTRWTCQEKSSYEMPGLGWRYG